MFWFASSFVSLHAQVCSLDSLLADRQRRTAVANFKSGTKRILVSTDVASRVNIFPALPNGVLSVVAFCWSVCDVCCMSRAWIFLLLSL